MTSRPGNVQDELTDILSAAAGIPLSLVTESAGESLENMGLDSLACMQLQAAVKDHFGIVIPDDLLSMSFEEITEFVAARLGDS
jgi:acyl carrier protein